MVPVVVQAREERGAAGFPRRIKLSQADPFGREVVTRAPVCLTREWVGCPKTGVKSSTEAQPTRVSLLSKVGVPVDGEQTGPHPARRVHTPLDGSTPRKTGPHPARRVHTSLDVSTPR
ncbi:hypothetical protein ACOMHN_003501 [Nucella lapillus]